jgi:hypothetical protein
VRIGCRIFSWANPRARSCSPGALTPAEVTSCPNSKIPRGGMTRHLPDEVFLVNCGSVRWGIRMVIHRICILAAGVIASGYRTR